MSVPETRFARAASAPPRSELERLRATCRRQAMAIDTLRSAVLRFSTATRALKAENAELRGEAARLRSEPAAGRDRVEGAELVEMPLAAGKGAPHAARVVIQRCLDGVVAPPVLADALLLVSELVTNSVRHSGVAEGEELVVRVHVWRGTCRLEVEDPGCDGRDRAVSALSRERYGDGAEPRADAQRPVGRRARGRRPDAGVGPAPVREGAGMRRPFEDPPPRCAAARAG